MGKKIFIALLMTLATLSSVAQVAQPCVVKQYDQKHVKTPLADVRVEVRDANTTTSDRNGMLTLQFNTKKPGDPVVFRSADKAGYEVMNKDIVNQWNISRDNKAFELVMIKSALLSQFKQNLHDVSTQNYKRKYEQAKEELARLQKENRLKQQEYLRRINELEDHYDLQLKNLDAYVDQFARIDLSEISEQEQHFVNLVYEGRLDEAALAYERLDAVGKYTTAAQNVARLNRDIQTMEGEKAKMEETAATLLSMLNRQVGTLKLAGGQDNFRKAGELLKRAALADTTNIGVVLDYAKFALSQQDYKEAERFYLMGLHGCKDDMKQQTIILNDLGKLYTVTGDYAKADDFLQKALENVTLLTRDHPDEHREIMVQTQIALGSLYNHTKDKEKAEKSYSSALDYLIDLFHADPDTYRPLLFNIQFNLSLLHMGFQNYTKAEDYLYQAMENVNILFEHTPDAYRSDLAATHHGMGNVYRKINAFSTAEEHYLKALDIYTQLFNLNPDAHRAAFASILSDLGVFYGDMHDHDKAEDFHLKALEHLTLLYNQTPDAYRASLANTQNNLGVLYDKSHNYLRAEEHYLKALEIYQQLYQQYPDAYRVDLTRIQGNLGFLYTNLKANNVAEEYLLKALESWTSLFKQDPDAYRPELANAQNHLGALYTNTRNYSMAEEYLNKASENYNLLFNQNQGTDAYREDGAQMFHNLGVMYGQQRRKDKALENYYLSLAIKKWLVKQDSVAYCPTMAETLSNMGNVYYHEKDYSLAELCLQRAIDNFKKVSPQNTGVYQADIDRLQRNLDVLRNNTPEYAKVTHKTKRKKISMYYIDNLTLSIPAGCNACIQLSGEGVSDLDMYVYDEDGEELWSDERYVDDCDYSFMPLEAMKLKVKIINRGEKTNNYTLTVSTW